jgi:LacI family transcriptional regulator
MERVPRAAQRLTTIRDIAVAVGVSVATVSNALNGRPNVGRDLRAKVLRIAAEIGYSPNRAAQAMRTGRSRALGLILPDLANPFFAQLAQAVANSARPAGLLTCLIDSQGSTRAEAEGFSLLAQHAVDAVIWCPVGPRLPAALRTFVRPVVLIDRPRPGYAVVHSDYGMGGRLLAEYALRMGHTRVGLLSGPRHLTSARRRRDGFATAFPRRLTIAWEVHVGFDGVLGADAVAALERRRDATLIVAGNDLIAIGAIRHLTAQGVRVPEHVSVTGFDDISAGNLITPRLTTVAQPIGAIGAKAVERILAMLAGRADAERCSVLGVALVERDSVRRPA